VGEDFEELAVRPKKWPLGHQYPPFHLSFSSLFFPISQSASKFKGVFSFEFKGRLALLVDARPPHPLLALYRSWWGGLLFSP
jgi:hypothetical protein